MPPAAVSSAGEQRAGGEAGVAGGLDPAVGLRQPRPRRPWPARARPRPGRDRGARAEQRGQHEDRREPVGEHEPARDHRLRQRDAAAARGASRRGPRAGPRTARSSDDRRHQRAEQRRDREAGAGQVVHAQREHDHEQHVAGRGEQHGGGQQAEIAGHPTTRRARRAAIFQGWTMTRTRTRGAIRARRTRRASACGSWPRRRLRRRAVGVRAARGRVAGPALARDAPAARGDPPPGAAAARHGRLSLVSMLELVELDGDHSDSRARRAPRRRGERVREHPPRHRWEDHERRLVIRDDGRLIACAGLIVAPVEVAGERFDVVGFGGVIVTRTRRGQGLARRVMEAAIAARGRARPGARAALLPPRPRRPLLEARLRQGRRPVEVGQPTQARRDAAGHDVAPAAARRDVADRAGQPPRPPF